MSYKPGDCAQCGTKIRVRDVDGRLNSKKDNYGEADLVFENGVKMPRVPLCKDCLSNIDYNLIMTNLFDNNSRAFSSKTKTFLKSSFGENLPTSFVVKG